jgi:hypothetical protein
VTIDELFWDIAKLRQLVPGYDDKPLDEAVRLTLDARDKTIAALRAQAAASTSPVPPSASAPAAELPGWALIFEDNFDIDCAEGELLAKYGARWRAYPNGWKDTA